MPKNEIYNIDLGDKIPTRVCLNPKKSNTGYFFLSLFMLLLLIFPMGFLFLKIQNNQQYNKNELLNVRMNFSNVTFYNYTEINVNPKTMGIGNSTWQVGKVGTQYYYQNFSFTESVCITDFTMFIKNQSNSINFTVSLFYQRPSNQYDPEYIVKKTIKINETSPKPYSNFTINFDSEICLGANHGYWFMVTFLNLNISSYFGSIIDNSTDDIETYHLIGSTWVNQPYTISYSMQTHQKEKIYYENASSLIYNEINLYNNKTRIIDYTLVCENDNLTLLNSYNFSIRPELGNIYYIILGFRLKDNVTLNIYSLKFEIKINAERYYFLANNIYNFSNFMFYKLDQTTIGLKEVELNNKYIIIE